MPEAPFEIIIQAPNAKKAFATIKKTEAIGFKKTFVEFDRPKGVREATILQAVQNSLIVHDLVMNAVKDPPAEKSEVKKRISIVNKFERFPMKSMSEIWDIQKPVGAIQLNSGKYLCFGMAHEK